MTNPPFILDASSYSHRTCRCGHAMGQGRAGTSRTSSWRCGSCGRVGRR